MQRMRSVILEFRGTVQGVGFRRKTVEKASDLGLKGFVRNREDGAVEVAAEGSLQALFALAEYLSERFSISEITCKFDRIQGPFDSFSLQ